MRRISTWFGVAVIAALLGGCPLLNGSRTFTSADVSNGGFFNGGAGAEGGNGPALDSGGERLVVEPDVIRREGNLLYVLNQFRGLSIVDLDADELLVQVPTLGAPRDLYFSGGVAYVLVDSAQTVQATAGTISVETASRVYAVDVSDPAEAFIRAEIQLAGNLVDSRLVGTVLYGVTANYDYGYGYGGGIDIAPASVTTSGTTTVTSIDVANPDTMAVADAVSFTGSGQVIHVNDEAAFIVTNDWTTNATTIVYLDITDPQGAIAEVGAMQVRGYVADRFKLDSWNGALRVVSSDWSGTSQVYVTTFDLADPALPRLAERRIEGAEGETLFATRFDGPRAYVVTFLVVDPLFVIDLSDPADPLVLGALEVPGYSTHIEARGDRLIALGVDDTEGRQINMSIFDVSGNGAPALLDRVRFGGDWSWSSAYNDVKALTLLDGVIIVPFSGWSDSGGYERLQFISHEGDQLTLRGTVDLSGTILRSFDYGGDFFGVTTEQLSRIDAANLDAPEVTATVTLAENLVDFLPVSGDLSVEIVARQADGRLLVRTVDGAQAILGELAIDGGHYQSAWIHRGNLIVVGLRWEGRGGYVVSAVDLGRPGGAPALTKTLNVAVDPYYSHFGFDIYGGGGNFPEAGVAVGDAVGYPFYYGPAGESGYLLSDTLALRCFANRFDRTIGGGEAYQGLALIDLNSLALSETVGLGHERIVSLDARAGKLYLSTKESAGNRLFSPMAACYVQELDVVGGAEGAPANVPGVFLDYNPDSDVLVLLDHQWASNGDYTTSLETVRWSGDGPVTRLESLALPGYSYNHRASEGRVYFERYDEGNRLQQVVVGNSGSLNAGAPLAYGAAYGYLLEVRGDHAFVSLGSGGIAHYTFSGGNGTLTQFVAAAGYPSAVRVGPDAAYLPMGYYGLVTLPL